MHEELATVRGVVDFSRERALDEAHDFLSGHGYVVVDRTETTLTAERRPPDAPSSVGVPSLSVTATPQPGGGVQIIISGDDREGLQEQRNQWLIWSERLPRRTIEDLGDPGASPSGAGEVLVEARGVDGQVELLPNMVRIRRRGLLAKGKGGDREIPFGQLESVEFKSGFTGGHIRFLPVGHQAQEGRRRTHEYEVQFKAQQSPDFEAIRREVERRAEHARGSKQASEVPPAGEAPSHEPPAQEREPAPDEPLAQASGGTKDLLVFADRVEVRRPLSLPPEVVSMSLAQVETVTIAKEPSGTNYATLAIEGAEGRMLAVRFLARDEAKRIKDLVERQAAEARRVRAESPEPVRPPTAEAAMVKEPATPPTPERRSGVAGDIPELIRKLAELKDAGVITDEEFEAKKVDLLERQRRSTP
jgi:hypothetical protein